VSAVVDAVQPSVGLIQPIAPVSPITIITQPQLQPNPTPVVSRCYDAGGNVVDCAAPATGGAAAPVTANFTAGTVTTNTGQVLTIVQGVTAAQAQAAADAALLAANTAAAAVTAVQTANTQVAALLPVDTAPASTAITTASPLVTGAATAYSTASLITPVATAPASTAVTTAATNVNAATTAVTAANALAPVVTTPATTAIATANTNIGTASPAVTTANGLTPANATLAANNATAATTAANIATTQTTTAATQLAANATFADVTAAPALAAAQAANATLQTANAAVQGAATTVSTNNTSLTAAQLAAQNALTAANSNLTTANSNLTTANNQNTALTAAQAAAQAALATAQSNLATANANLTTATNQNAALTAAQLAAQNALTAANSNLATANTNLTTATTQNATITAAKASISTQLTAAQAAAVAAQTAATAAQAAAAQATTLQAAGDLVGAQAQLTIAQNQLTIAQQQQAAAAAAQTAATNLLTSAQTARTTGLTNVADAVTAATTAQAAANTVTTQAALVAPAETAASTAVAAVTPAATTATTDAGTASTQASAAQTAASAAATAVGTATTVAGTAATDATTASNQAAAAQTASTNATAALTTSTTSLATVNTSAPTIAANAPVAAYNNPAVAGSFIGVAMFPVATAGGFNEAFSPSNPPQLNTTYVLNGSGNLVEARNMPFRVQANQNGTVLTPSILGAAGADIKWSNGTAADTIKLVDNSIYMGRWMGATVTVTDNATPANVYTYTPAASLWAVVLPPPAGYEQTLVGTVPYTYLAGNATIPVDAIGNLGTLNSASLVANFTMQTVNAAVNLTMGTGPMAGTFNVSGTAMPIDPNGQGFGVPNAGSLATSCTVGTCAAGSTGYSADLGGGFAGTGAASAGMSYNIWPTTALVSDPAIDSIQGLVAFTTATAPSAGTNPLAGNWESFSHLAVGGAGAWGRGRFNLGALAAQPNTSFILDGAGNLVRSLHVDYNERQTWQSGAAVNVFDDASITYSGGVASDRYTTPDGSLTIGRWTGGQLTIADNLSATTLVKNLGVTSAYWGLGSAAALTANYVQSLIGTTTYTQMGATLPTDTFGNVGTVPVATLSANFTNQTVDGSVAFTIAAQNLTVAATGVPIVAGASFFDATLETGNAPTVGCTGTCSGGGYLGWLSGAFNGATARSADLAYKIWPTAAQGALVTDIVQGIVALYAGTAPTVNPAGPLAAYVATGTSVAYTGSYGGGFNFIAASGGVTPSGNPTTFTQTYGGGSGSRTDVLNGATTATPQTTTTKGITFGLWDTVASVSATEQNLFVPNPNSNMTGTLPSYMYGAEGYLDSPVVAGTNTGPMTGTFTYNQVAATSFNQDVWATGSVTSATLSANFTNQTVSVALAGTMGVNNWTANSTNRPISFMSNATGTGTSFKDYAPVIKVATTAITGGTPVCATCGGNIDGTFVGQNYAGAIVRYNLWDDAPATGMNAGGLIAFSNSSPVGTGGTPTGITVVANSWQLQSASAITTNGSGVLTGWSGTGGWSSTVAPASGSAAQTAVGAGSGTINWGQWGAGSVHASSFSYTPATNQFHWITAPEPTPVYLAEVLTATNAVYNLVDGDVTSLNGGAHGTAMSASLTANFTTQTVAVSLATTVNGHNWLANTTNAPLTSLNSNSLTGFYADSGRGAGEPGYLTVTVDAIPAYGNLAGQLVGAALDGAILKFNLDGQGTAGGYEFVQGVAALGAVVANDPATAYRMVVTSISDPTAPVPTAMVGGSYNNAARVLTDVNGLTKFDDNTGGGGSTIQHVSGTYSDQGSAVIGGDTVSWGRWDAGTVVTVTDRTTNAAQNITLAGGAHAVVGPLMTGPVSLPTSGTYTYTKVGNTLPTDQAGVAGTLNSASLSANFTAQTVDVGVNVTAGGATLGATAVNVPIQQRAMFVTDSRMTGTGSLAVTCSGVCGTTNHGIIGGGFGGPGGVGAAITYGFEKGGTNAGTVSGVAVFQR
jgi:hypothetical protein